MHIEPGIVTGAKMLLSYGTGAAVAAYGLRLAWESARERGIVSVVARSILATVAAFSFFEVLPHHPVGVSEVHFILGSSLFLIFGAGPAAIGLGMGLLLQGLFFAPLDLPQYGINLTTLLVPLFGLGALARRIITRGTPFVDLKYRQALALSVAYQGGIVSWVAFWALFGQGFSAWQSILTFGGAYMLVVLIEPLVDLALLGAAKGLRRLEGSPIVTRRLYAGA